ncbi:MAG: hypothetical protein GEV06_17950 [Luteitalea sp.]|nr:hypothetical protein [Luteitalea sp.]
MTSDEAVAHVIDALTTEAIPFMVVGSLATNVHGVPRSTRDADFVVEVSPGALERLVATLGPAFRLNPQASFETITGTTRHVIELRGSPFTFELFGLTDDPHDRERFVRRQRMRLLARHAFVMTAEDTVITKLRWARQGNRAKDLDDARNVLAVQGSSLDWTYIERWCAQHGTRALLDSLRQSLSSGDSC